MTFDQYEKEFNRAIDEVEKQTASTMVEIGHDALFMIKERIVNEGINAKGEKFRPYSERPMLVNCSSLSTSVCSRLAGSKKKRRELNWVTLQRGGRNIKLFELERGYKEYRELHGRKTDHVSFFFTGQMWSDIGIISNDGDHANHSVTIGAKDEDNKNKLSGNTAKRGDILDLSEAEKIKLAERYKLKILKVYKELL